MRPPFRPAAGLVMDPWRFDPGAAVAAANRVIQAGHDAPGLVGRWVSEAARLEAAMAAVMATRIAVMPVPAYGRASNFRADAPLLPHHPFVVCGDVPFLPAESLEVGGAMMAPADQIKACFRHGVLRKSPLAPEDPVRAVFALLSSEEWFATIMPEMAARASWMVRLQAARATGRAPDFEPSTAEDDRLEEWWERYIQPQADTWN